MTYQQSRVNLIATRLSLCGNIACSYFMYHEKNNVLFMAAFLLFVLCRLINSHFNLWFLYFQHYVCAFIMSNFSWFVFCGESNVLIQIKNRKITNDLMLILG